MERPRLAGGRLVTSAPSISIRPPVASSSPAISRSKVDLPQPEGPTKTTNWPSSISRSMEGMMMVSPKALRTSLSTILPVISPPPCYSFDGAEGEAAHELALGEPAQDQDRRDRHGRGRRELGPEQAFRARIGSDEDRERGRVRGRQVQRPEGLVPGQDHIEQHCRGDAGH